MIATNQTNITTLLQLTYAMFISSAYFCLFQIGLEKISSDHIMLMFKNSLLLWNIFLRESVKHFRSARSYKLMTWDIESFLVILL